MYNNLFLKITKKILLCLVFFLITFLLNTINLYAATVTYNFNSDTVGQTPANTTANTGTFQVANQAVLGNSLTATGLTGPANTAAITFNNFTSDTDQTVTWKEAYQSGGGRHGFTLRAQSGNSAIAGLKQGYLFQVNHTDASASANKVRVYKVTSTTFDILAEVSLTAQSPRWFKATVSGNQLSFYYSDNGTNYTQLGTTVTDSTYTSGLVQYSAGYGSGVGDMYVDDIVYETQAFVPDAIAITSPSDYQVFQRDNNNQSDISISGTYTGSPVAIEARFNGGTWTTIDASLSGGTFSGVLENQDIGQGSIEVRFSNNSDVNDSAAYVGVGDIYAIAGQSNASGRGLSNQVYSHPTLKASKFTGSWAELTDPADGVGGTVWPIVATRLMESQDVPVAFITDPPQGGTSIAQWQKGQSLYTTLASRINAIGEMKAVLFWQGETDVANATSRTTYNSSLDTMVNNIYNDFGLKTVVAQIGEFSGEPAVDLNNIRLAQLDAWEDNSNVLAGPSLYDVNLSNDGLHFRTNEEIEIAANRWWAAIEYHFYNGDDGRGPQYLISEENITRNKIAIMFSDNTLPLLPTSGIQGFRVEDNGVSVAISSVARTSDNIITITLNSPLSGDATVSLGYGDTANGLVVPTDSSVYNLPAEIFINEIVSSAVPPILSSGAPSAELSVDTTSTTLSLTTNETATCKYDTTSAVAYASMDVTFSTTGGTSHSVVVNSLENGNSYTYYVKCTDSVGNPNTEDYIISFSVAEEIPSEVIYPTTIVSSGSRSQKEVPLPSYESLIKQLHQLKLQLQALQKEAGVVQDSPAVGLPLNIFIRDLTLGSKGEDVKALQIFLNTNGSLLTEVGTGSPGRETDYFGPLTKASLAKYQSMNNINPANGYFGPVTRNYITLQNLDY